jgi:hypothetical protein
MDKKRANDGEYDEDDLFVLPLKNAMKAQFPVGCPVLICGAYQRTPTEILAGSVESVLINLNSESRESLYKVRIQGSSATNHSQSHVVKSGRALQLPPRCPVWMNVAATTIVSARTEKSLVLGSENYPADKNNGLGASVLYSVQILSGHIPNMLCHGVVPGN